MCFIEIKQKVGRPRKAYEDASVRTRRRRRRQCESSNIISTDELCDIAKKKLRLDKNSSGSKLIHRIFDHEDANQLLSMATKPQSTKMSQEEALSNY